MYSYLLHRLILAIPTLFGMTLVGFFLITLAPGDPVELALRQMGVTFTTDQIMALQKLYGLDQPLWQQYLNWLWRLCHLDFGTSIATGRPVWAEFKQHFPVTALISVAALLIAIPLSFLIGGCASLSHSPVLKSGLRLTTIVMISVPGFWLSFLLLSLFGLYLNWVSLISDNQWQDYILPILTLSLPVTFFIGRLVKDRLDMLMSEDHFRLALTKGNHRTYILRHHFLPLLLPPLITYWAVSFGRFLGGSVIIETIYGLPGMGQWVLQAISDRDYAVLQTYLLLMGFLFFMLNLGADCANRALDPLQREGI